LLRGQAASGCGPPSGRRRRRCRRRRSPGSWKDKDGGSINGLPAADRYPLSAVCKASARAYVRALLPAWHLEPLADDAELVVSELVTNAGAERDVPQ